MKNIALLFGSFNPVHNGHLIIAQSIANKNNIDEVWLVVSPQNPFKQQKKLLNQYDRLHLIRLGIGENLKIKASDIEFNLPIPSYTIDTLTYLQEKFPKNTFTIVMGSDNINHFHKWKNFQSILKYYRIIVYPRPNHPIKQFENHEKVEILKVPLLEISATYIRKLLKEQKSIRYLVPDSVYDYIIEQRLFK